MEHMEVAGEDKPLQPVFRDHVAGGAAFGATRWVSALQRQCERLASELARNIADQGGTISHRIPSLSCCVSTYVIYLGFLINAYPYRRACLSIAILTLTFAIRLISPCISLLLLWLFLPA